MDKFSPIQAINAISGKHKEAGITQKASQRKNPENQTTMLFSHHIGIAAIDVQGYSEEASKKFA